jgi:hypothetical protein
VSNFGGRPAARAPVPAWGFHTPGAKAVYRGSMLCEFTSHRLGQPHDAKFQRDVAGEEWCCGLFPGHRRGVHNHSLRPSANHNPCCGVASVGDCLDNDLEGPIVLLDRKVKELLHEGDAGIANLGPESDTLSFPPLSWRLPGR